jgi:hypothetical protein
MAGKAKDQSVSEAVAAFAESQDLDQVVMVGWRAKDERYVMVAHGRNRIEEVEANAFADRLMNGIVADAKKIDRYGNKKAKQSG